MSIKILHDLQTAKNLSRFFQIEMPIAVIVENFLHNNKLSKRQFYHLIGSIHKGSFVKAYVTDVSLTWVRQKKTRIEVFHVWSLFNDTLGEEVHMLRRYHFNDMDIKDFDMEFFDEQRVRPVHEFYLNKKNFSLMGVFDYGTHKTKKRRIVTKGLKQTVGFDRLGNLELLESVGFAPKEGETGWDNLKLEYKFKIFNTLDCDQPPATMDILEDGHVLYKEGNTEILWKHMMGILSIKEHGFCLSVNHNGNKLVSMNTVNVDRTPATFAKYLVNYRDFDGAKGMALSIGYKHSEHTMRLLTNLS